MKKTIPALLFLLVLQVQAQKPTDYFPLSQSRKYLYRFLDAGSRFLNQWQVVAAGPCNGKAGDCIKIDMKSQPGTYTENGKVLPAKENMLEYNLELEVSEAYLNLRKWNRYEDLPDQLSQTTWLTELPLIKLPDAGKDLTQTGTDERYQAAIHFEFLPVFTVNNKKYQKVLLTTWELTDLKTGKPAGKHRFFFVRNTGLLRYEAYNPQNQLDLKHSFELEKIN